MEPGHVGTGAVHAATRNYVLQYMELSINLSISDIQCIQHINYTKLTVHISL